MLFRKANNSLWPRWTVSSVPSSFHLIKNNRVAAGRHSDNPASVSHLFDSRSTLNKIKIEVLIVYRNVSGSIQSLYISSFSHFLSVDLLREVGPAQVGNIREVLPKDGQEGLF